MEVLYGIYGQRSAVRVGDFKLIIGEQWVQLANRPVARTELGTLMRPVTVWDSELECTVYPDAIGCWPNIEPCLFNVRFDPCEVNNVAYYMPQTVEALRYSLTRYNESALYRDKRALKLVKDLKSKPGFKRTLRRLKRSLRTLRRHELKIPLDLFPLSLR